MCNTRTNIQSHTYTHTYTVIQAHIHTHTHTYPHTYKRTYMFETSASFSCQGMSLRFFGSPLNVKRRDIKSTTSFKILYWKISIWRKIGLCWGWKDNDNCGGEDWWCKFRYLVDGCLSKLMRLRMDVGLWRYYISSALIHGPCLLIKMISGPRNLPTGLSVKRPVLQVHQNPTKSLWEVEIVCFVRNISYDSFFQNGISNPILSMARNVLCSFLVLLALRRNEEHPKTSYKKNHRILVVYKQDNKKNTSGVTQQFTSGRQVVKANYEPLYQNRSHYVSSGYATQWKALDSWWEEHGWAVCQLLEPEEARLIGDLGEVFGERHGTWYLLFWKKITGIMFGIARFWVGNLKKF